MSREQNYFPPQGTKFKWGAKVLRHSSWHCCISDQREPDIRFRTNMRVEAHVDLNNGKFKWVVAVTDHDFSRRSFSGIEDDPLAACLAAEKLGEQELDKLLPDWVRTALANKWRPPCLNY